jgi:acyl-CoA thioesterase
VTFPLQEFLGMQLLEDTAGVGTAKAVVVAEHLNPNGVVHGGVIFTLVDTAMGKATMSVLDVGLFCATVEISLRFIRPASTGTMIAVANVVKRGRNIVHVEARVQDDSDRLIATGTGTFAVMGG